MEGRVMADINETSKVVCSAAGATTVTITVTCGPARSSYSYKGTQSGIAKATEICRREALKNLRLMMEVQ
jgi:hypothetical protein